MRRIALAVVVAALAVVPAALAASAPSGTYKTTITGSKKFGGVLNGKWTLKFTSGHYVVKHNGKLATKGVNTVAGNVITFKDSGGSVKCTGTGKYTFKITGQKLNFTKVSDSSSCAGRQAVLKHTFTKVS